MTKAQGRKTELGWDEGMDLSQIAVLIGVSVCPSPKGDGIELSPFLGDGVVEFPNEYLVLGCINFSPSGETGERFNARGSTLRL